MRVIDYSIIESDNHAELVEAVLQTCRENHWVPCGGVCVWFEPGRRPDELGYSGASGIVHYVQALVKYAA